MALIWRRGYTACGSQRLGAQETSYPKPKMEYKHKIQKPKELILE
jgi:hypothetical protein